MRSRTLTWILAALMTACCCGSAYAQNEAHAKKHGGARAKRQERLKDRPIGGFLESRAGELRELGAELNLTPEQRGQIRQALAAHKAELAEAMKIVAEKKRTLRDVVLDENADEAKVRAAADDLGKAVGDAAVLMKKVKAEILPILTPDQQEAIKRFREKKDQDVDAFLDDVGKQQ